VAPSGAATSFGSLSTMDPESPKFLVRTFGCQMNEHDSERLAGLLSEEAQMAPTVDESDADVIVLNTCCIRENADNKLYGTLGHLKTWKAEREGRRIVVAGCLSQKDKGAVQNRAPYVDLVVGTHNIHRTALLLERAVREGPLTEIYDEAVEDDRILFPSALPVRRDSTYAAWVTIQIGCDNTCAYCIVPAVRGKEVSRPMESILEEVKALAADGVTEVTLLGQNVNSYGRDIALAARRSGEAGSVRPMFDALLRAVGAIPGIRRVRYTSPHPKDMRADVLHAMADTDAICEHLHYPLQSGSDAVLAAMHRGYTAERYLTRLAEARVAIADLAVTTDIIVGFPGETDDDFAATLEVAAAAEFDSAYTFIFSPREGTEAAMMTDAFVAPAVIADRFERLRTVVEHSALLRHQARVGRTEEIVVEGRSRRGDDLFAGRTRQNKLLHFASREPIRPGTYAAATVTRGAPHHLEGELQEVLFVPARRTRIPVSAAD